VDLAKARKLIEVLTRLHASHLELRGVLVDQQQALRRFDAAGLDVLHRRGDRLAERIAELESARLELTGPSTKLTDLAGQLAPAERSRLLAVAHELRQVAGETASLGRINHTAVQCMLNHFHSVYRLMAQAGRPASYGAGGLRKQPSNGAFLVDAVA
jgi:hypothetical protein